VRNIFKSRFRQAKGNVDYKIKKMTVSGLGLKRKRITKKAQSKGKSRKMKDIFTAK
jgi:hypothetical protein